MTGVQTCALPICRVIAVVGCRREDGIEIDDRDAKPLEVRKLLADALERAACTTGNPKHSNPGNNRTPAADNL